VASRRKSRPTFHILPHNRQAEYVVLCRKNSQISVADCRTLSQYLEELCRTLSHKQLNLCRRLSYSVAIFGRTLSLSVVYCRTLSQNILLCQRIKRTFRTFVTEIYASRALYCAGRTDQEYVLAGGRAEQVH